MAKKKILIVEDEPDLVEALSVRLEANDYQVIRAYDGREGLEIARKEALDLILLDIMLPEIDGYKICCLLKNDAKYSKIPIIMLTALAQKSDKKTGEGAGADAYIIKPFDCQVLLSKIKELLKS